MVARLVKALRAEMERAAEDVTADAVHDLRVAVRRLSEALRIFDCGRRARKRIRRVRDQAAAVRDRDVTLALLRRHGLPARDPAIHYLRGQRDLAAAQLADFLKRELRHPPEPPPEQGTPRPLLPAVETFLQTDPTQHHTLRIAAKRLRYAIEILDPPGAGLWLKRLRNLQRQLGDLHDTQVAAEFLSPHTHARATLRKLNAAAQRHEATFQNLWRRDFGPRSQQRLLTWAKSTLKPSHAASVAGANT